MPRPPQTKSKDAAEPNHFEPPAQFGGSPRIFEYKIKHAFLLSELEAIVNDMVALGWIPSGGIVFVPKVPNSDTPLHGFYQPLVKEG